MRKIWEKTKKSLCAHNFLMIPDLIVVPENPILGYPIRDGAMNENIYNGFN